MGDDDISGFATITNMFAMATVTSILYTTVYLVLIWVTSPYGALVWRIEGRVQRAVEGRCKARRIGHRSLNPAAQLIRRFVLMIQRCLGQRWVTE